MRSGNVSLDTSVVLRLLVGFPADQARVAKEFVSQRLADNKLMNISDLVLAETYFALQSFYRIPKSEALAMIALLSAASGFVVSRTATEVLALPSLSVAKPGFVDRLIHGTSHCQGHTLVTFEKASKKLPGTHVLQA